MSTNILVMEFIKKHTLAVIFTFGEIAPESAVLEFAETDQLEILFDTFTSSRKYVNIQKNPNVSFVIGWDQDLTVQYEGTAVELDGEELEAAKNIYFKKIPAAVKWANREGIVYFKVKPRWVRLTDLNQYPWDIKEISF
jgi:uncharacterized protein YhbP (UPF0306 family)